MSPPEENSAVIDASTEAKDAATADLLEPEVTIERLTGRKKFAKILRDNLFMITTIVGVLLGFCLGVIIRLCTDGGLSSQALLWLEMPGNIFIRLLKLTILPLIAANVVVVSANLDPKVNGKISLISFAYIIVANVGSAIIGCLAAVIIRPGATRITSDSDLTMPSVKFAKLTTSDVFADLLYNIFPDNIIGVAVFKTQTKYRRPLRAQLIDIGLIDYNGTVDDARAVDLSNSVNMIGVIFCAAVFGMAAKSIGESGDVFIKFFESLSAVVTKVMRWFLWMTPPGVCFMIAASVAGVADPRSTFLKLGMFIVTVTVGLGVHFVLLQVAFLVAARRNPLMFLPLTLRSWFISFATTAPVVAIPEMLDCCDRYGICRSVSGFVIPFAAALKGDGSACFIAAAAVFVAQMTGFPVTIGTIVIIVLLVSSAMLALPNIPSASLVILVTILTSIGASEKEVALLYAIDWLLDRMRSGSIGLSHCYCAAVTHFLCADDLKAEEKAEFKAAAASKGESSGMAMVEIGER